MLSLSLSGFSLGTPTHLNTHSHIHSSASESLVKVNLIGRNTNMTLGGKAELMCRIRGPRHAITLAWTVQRDASGIDTILTLYSDGTISWSGDPYRYQVKVDARQNDMFHYLLINDASHRQAGSYQCIVSVFQENAYKKLPSSNNVAVMVHNPGTDDICEAACVFWVVGGWQGFGVKANSVACLTLLQRAASR